LTTEEKNARAAGYASPLQYEQAKTQQTEDAKQYTKLYTGISGMGNSAAQSLPQIQAAQSIIDSPDFYSGPGAQAKLLWKQALAVSGLNPNAAVSMEAFNKTMSSFVIKTNGRSAGTSNRAWWHRPHLPAAN